MKKKTVAVLAAGALVVGMIPVALFASSQNTVQQLVDINGNGVSHHSSMCCEQYIDVNQEGTCDRHGPVCNGFIDEDGDGFRICRTESNPAIVKFHVVNDWQRTAGNSESHSTSGTGGLS